MDSRSTNSSPLRSELKISKVILLADIISGILSLLFLYTALSKLIRYEMFKNVLASSPMLEPFSTTIAWLLPATEIAIVVLLFIPRLRIKGLLASLILITLFTIYLLYMIDFTPHLPCNCGGVIKLLTWPQHIVFNLFFIFLSLTGIVLYRRTKSLKSSPPP